MVSNKWNVKSLWYINRQCKIRRELLLSPFIKKWRLYVKLCNLKRKHITVSRLVAQAFLWLDISSRWNLVCHKDDNPMNNIVTNLFIWTPKDNTQDMISKWRCNSGKYKQKTAYQFDINQNLLCSFKSTWEASRVTWISQSSISLCCLWKIETAGGCIWKY